MNDHNCSCVVQPAEYGFEQVGREHVDLLIVWALAMTLACAVLWMRQGDRA